MSKHICIIGGSGFVGTVLARQAVAAGHKVVVACRHPEKARHLLVDGVRLAKVDITDGYGLDEAMVNADCVINLVGLLAEGGRYTFNAAHVLGTEHIIAAAERLGVKQYLHMSAMGAGDVPDSVYATTKLEAETRVKASSLAWTIMRPSIIYGAGDSFFNQFKKLSAVGPVLPVIAPDTRFQPVWVEDVARAFVISVGNRHVASQTFELAGPDVYSFKELLSMLMDVLGRKRFLLNVPDIAAKILAASPLPMLTSDQLHLLQHDNIAKAEAFPTQFGEAAKLSCILPTYIRGTQPARLHHQLSAHRQHYRR